MPTAGGLYWWTHFFASAKTRNPLCFLVGYSNTLGLVGGLCSIDCMNPDLPLFSLYCTQYLTSLIDAFALMFLSVIVVARDGNWTPSNGAIYGTFLACVVLHGMLASSLSKVMGKLQSVFVVANFILIFATIIALPIGARHNRNSGHYIFAQTENATTWPTGWAFMLAWLSPIWTIGGFDSCVHMSEEAANATKAVVRSPTTPMRKKITANVLQTAFWNLNVNRLLLVLRLHNRNSNRRLHEPRPKLHQPRQFRPTNGTGECITLPLHLKILRILTTHPQIYYDALGKHGTLGMMTLLFIVQFLMGLSILVAASRQAWAFSRDGALPFSTFFRPISAKFGYIPLRTVWGCVFVALVLGLLTLIAPAAAQAVFSLAVAGNNLAWLIPILARVVWGQSKFKPGPFYTGRFSIPIAWTAIGFLVFGIILAMFPVGGPNPTREFPPFPPSLPSMPLYAYTTSQRTQ